MRISCCYLYAISRFGYPPAIPDMYRALEEMAGMGFHAVELEGFGTQNMRLVADEAPRLRRHCESLGLQVVNFCAVLPDLISPLELAREEAIQSFALATEVATFFGCETIQTDSYAPPIEFVGETPYKEALKFGLTFRVKVDPRFSWPDLWQRLVTSISRCNAMAKRAGLRCCLEPRIGETVSNTDALLRLMDAVGDDNFGAVLDTGHQHPQKEILPLSVEKLGSRIFYLHVSDNDGLTNQHLALGRGTIDWEGLFRALQKHNFQGYVAVDIGGVPDLREQYLESQAFLERWSTAPGI